MKKMLYITTTQFDQNSTGIGRKIYKQISLFKENGYDVTVYNQFTDERFLTRLTYLMPFCNTKYQYHEIMQESNVDYLYLRYFLADVKLIEMLRVMREKNPSMKLVVEIPTYPYDGEIGALTSKLWKDRRNRSELCKYVDRIVTFSNDEEIYGISTIRISNAVDIEKIQINCFQELEDHRIHLIGVAQLDFWHGYDRVIEGLAEYYKSGGKEQFVFHIVGYGKPKVIQNYKKKIQMYHLEEYIIFHGKQYGAELDWIYSQCLLAVDSLGRHRSHVYYNSSLKGKEYMAKGLPIISGVTTEMDEVENYPYYFRVPADESPIDFQKIASFYHRIYDSENPKQVAVKIRSYCESHFAFNVAYRPLIEYFQNQSFTD